MTCPHATVTVQNVNLAGVNLHQVHQEVARGQRSRHGFLEEVERHLESSGNQPLEGALQIILEELHNTPEDPHLLRLLALLHERDGDPAGARRMLAIAKGAESGAEQPRPSLEGRLLHARVLLEAGQVSEAEDVARQAIVAEPKSLSALSLLAKICHIQGRLTETIKLWQRIQLLSPHREGALAQLGILHRLARDDELVRMRFVAVGEDAYAQKHQGQIELESAFARFRDRDFDGAQAICEQLAARYRGKSTGMYKLAVLQKAWLQERTGDLEGARATLQQLGRERGFEIDLDRLGFLARICERIGTPDAIQQAIPIYEHLNLHYGKLSALPRLAALTAACSDAAKGAAYARQYERRFARRMQKPSPAEVVRALALQYIPLTELPPLALGPEEQASIDREIRLTPIAASRQRLRALLAYFLGDVAKAQRYWRRLTRSRSSAARDFGYLADTHAAEGRWSEAQSLYVEALRRAPSEQGLWRQSLRGPQARSEVIAELLTDPAILRQAQQTLHRAARMDHADPRRWEDLAILESWARLEREASAHRNKAKRLRDAISASSDAGRVLVAAVYSLNGKWKGIIHEILAIRRPTTPGAGGTLDPYEGILGSATPDLIKVVRTTLATTKDFARSHWPHLCRNADDYFYALKIAKEDEPSSGTSAGLPIAISFLSLLLGKQVPKGIAMTGGLVSDSQREAVLKRVGDALYKVKGAYHRNLPTVLLPEENREDVEAGDVVPLTVARQLVCYAATLTGAVEAIWGREAWDW